MTTLIKKIAVGGIAVAAVLAFSGLASAGECPKDKMMAGAVTSGETMPKNVTDTLIASIDLSPKGGDFKDNALRLRRLVIAPGGVVPWHDHKVRPATIYILSGEVTEHRSTCGVPIAHKAGDVIAEFGEDLAHWWENTGSAEAVLLSADILPPQMKTDGMM